MSGPKPRLRDSLAEAMAVALLGMLAWKALPWAIILLLLSPLVACVV